MVTPSARPRGMMVTLCTGSHLGSSLPIRAWPDSWYAVLRRSSSGMTMLLRSGPIRILSLARSKSCISTVRALRRGAGRHRRSVARAPCPAAAPGGAAGRNQRGFVVEVCQVWAAHAGRATGDDAGGHVLAHRDLAHVHVQDLLAATDVGQRYIHLAVEAAGA